MRGKVIVMANLKPRVLAGFTSNGMVVCASNHEHTKVELLVPEGPLGERLYL
jgi:tRNA-binding EMAP/Myf-like protein